MSAFVGVGRGAFKVYLKSCKLTLWKATGIFLLGSGKKKWWTPWSTRGRGGTRATWSIAVTCFLASDLGIIFIESQVSWRTPKNFTLPPSGLASPLNQGAQNSIWNLRFSRLSNVQKKLCKHLHVANIKRTWGSSALLVDGFLGHVALYFTTIMAVPAWLPGPSRDKHGDPYSQLRGTAGEHAQPSTSPRTHPNGILS